MGSKRLTLAAALVVCAAFVAGSLAAQAQSVSGVSINANSLQVVKPPRAVDTVPSRTDRHVATNINNYPDYAQGVQFQDAVPSPVGGGNIDNYINQEQRLEIKPTDKLVRVLRTDQKNLIQSYVQKVIPVNNVDTIEILPAIKTVCEKEGGEAETIRDYTKHKYAIQVVVPAEMIPSLEKAIAALDVEWASSFNDGSADLYYKAKYRDVELVDRIASAFGSGFERTVGYSTIDGTNNAVLRQDEQYWIDRYLTGKLADIPEHMINLEGAIYELNMNNDLKLGLDYIAWKNGPGRNLFDFLLAGQHNHEDYKNASSVYNPGLTNVGLFTGRDVPIEVVADSILDDLGIGGDPFSDNRRHYEQEGTQEYYAANFLMTAAYFDFLQSKGKAKVLGRPSITTRSGSVGTWTSVDQILAFESGEIVDPNGNMVDSNITTNPGFEGTTPDLIRDQLGNFVFGDIGEIIPSIQKDNPVELYDSRHWGDFTPLLDGYGDTNVSPRVLRYKNSGQTGVFLSILPMIGTETTELTVDYASSDLNGYTPQGTPIINTRTYDTTVRVADGQPFVVGGLSRSEKLKSKQGAPWLSALPVIGYLFGQESNADRKDTIVMVLTPNIYTGAQSDMEMPAEAKTVMAQAQGEADVALPKNPFGFDQWMLDKEKN